MRHDISARIFSIMARMGIQPSPTNYELLHEIISGNNPALRDRFMQLGSAPDAGALAKLAEEFLPHHFGQAIGDQSTTAIKAELEQLIGSLSKVQQDFDTYSSVLATATAGIDTAGGDRDAIQSRLRELADATVRQRENNTSFAANVQQRLTAITAVSEKLDEAERIKFTHQATGLHNRRSFNKHLADTLGSGKMPEDISIILGQIGNFRIFETGNLLKIKAQMLARIGVALRKVVPMHVFVGWIETPHIAILTESTQRSEIEWLVSMVRGALAPVFDDVHKRLPNYLPLTLSFGACDAYNAISLADMLDKAEKALIEAEKAPGGSLVIFDAADKTTAQRHNYALYQAKNERASPAGR